MLSLPLGKQPFVKRLVRVKIALFLLAAPGFPLAAQQPAACTIDTVAGGGSILQGEGGPARQAELYNPADVRRGPDGLLYIADTDNNVIRRILGDGTIETFAGTGRTGYSGDGGPARAANLGRPSSLAFGPDGSLYFFENAGSRVRRISPDGTISTIAGNGSSRFTGDDGPAIEASIGSNSVLTVSNQGIVVLATAGHSRVRVITPDGIIRTLAGSGDPLSVRGFFGDGGPANEAGLNGPTDVAVDSDGNVYIADSNNRRIRRVTPNGIINTYLGGGILRRPPDGTPRAETALEFATQIEIDSAGRLYWWESDKVQRITDGDLIETVAQNPLLTTPTFRLGASDEILLLRLHQLHQITAGAEPALLAGVGRTAGRGDGGLAVDARLGGPRDIAVGPNGELYIADPSFFRVRVVRPDGRIEAFAGTGETGFSGDGGPAIDATFFSPRGIASDAAGNVYISDANNNRLRRVSPDGIIDTVAGNGSRCFNINDCDFAGPALEVVLEQPAQIAIDSLGALYVMDTNTRRNPRTWVRKVVPGGMASSIPVPTEADVRTFGASAIAVDREDRLIISAGRQDRGTYWTFSDEEGLRAYDPANGYLALSYGLAVSPLNDLHASDEFRRSIRRLSPDGVLDRLAATDASGSNGGGGPEPSGPLGAFRELAFDAAGNLYLIETVSNTIRRIHRAVECERKVGPEMALRGVVNAASYQLGNFAPGLIFTIFGRRLGPAELVGTRLENGRLATELGGTRVLVDGVPAPLIYSYSGQISAIIPFGTRLTPIGNPLGFDQYVDPAVIEVEYQGARSEQREAIIVETMPGIFTLDASGSGIGAILNEDGRVNSQFTPAAPGSIIVIFATGGGVTEPAYADGELVGSELPYLTADIEVTVGGKQADVLYAGGAPSLVAGVVQINVRLPQNFDTLGAQTLNFKAAGIASQDVNVIVGF